MPSRIAANRALLEELRWVATKKCDVWIVAPKQREIFRARDISHGFEPIDEKRNQDQGDKNYF